MKTKFNLNRISTHTHTRVKHFNLYKLHSRTLKNLVHENRKKINSTLQINLIIYLINISKESESVQIFDLILRLNWSLSW